MNRLSAVTIIFTLAVVPTFAQTTSQQWSPQGTIERFCTMDADGAQLTPEGWNGMGALLVHRNLWYPRNRVLVVREYAVHGPDLHGNTANFTVNYEVWGQIDSSLRFERLEGLAANRPTRKREYLSVVRTNKHFELGSDEHWHELAGEAEWRLQFIPSAPHISVNTAIDYVRKMRDESSNPAVKDNAEQTLTNLNALSGTNATNPTVSDQESPKKALWRYCTLETQGAGLTSQGWSKLQSFLVRQKPWRRDKILVTRDFALSDAGIDGNRAELFAEYLYVGELDPNFRFVNKPFDGYEGNHPLTGPVKVRVPYTLVFGNKYWELQGGAAANEKDGPPQWRIDDPHPEQWITIDAAIEYLTHVANTTTDKAKSQNARTSVITLKRLR